MEVMIDQGVQGVVAVTGDISLDQSPKFLVLDLSIAMTSNCWPYWPGKLKAPDHRSMLCELMNPHACLPTILSLKRVM